MTTTSSAAGAGRGQMTPVERVGAFAKRVIMEELGGKSYAADAGALAAVMDRLITAENFLHRIHETDRDWRAGTITAQEAMVTIAAISGAWRSANPRAQERT